MTETHIKQQIRDYLKIQGFFTFPIVQGLGAAKGIPDRMAFKNDRALLIEVKTFKGKLSPEQAEFKKSIEMESGKHIRYILARSLEDVMQVVMDMGLESHKILF